MINPWSDIALPYNGKTNAKRAELEHPHDFFWAKGTSAEELLIFQCDKEINCKDNAPKLNGIEIVEHIPEEGNKKNIVIALKEKDNLEIFYILCRDVLDATRKSKKSKEALSILYRRTWRWHQLLKKGFSGLLSKEAQKGLVGELNFLSKNLFKMFSITESLSFWEGPTGSPKDFCLGKNAVEVKTRRGSAQPYVSISSEHQLDKVGFDNLYLYVVNISPGIEESISSFTLTIQVNNILKTVRELSPADQDIFIHKLMEVGYFPDDDYSEFIWEIVDENFYDVEELFPRISNSSLPDGVSQITYKIDLNICKDYLIDELQVKQKIKE